MVLRQMMVAGALVLLVHQPLVWLLHALGVVPWQAFDRAPIAPFGVPAVLNAMFWGALWAPLIGWLYRRTPRPLPPHAFAACVTAMLTLGVGAVLVRLGRGAALPPDTRLKALAGGLLINAVWAGLCSMWMHHLRRTQGSWD
jgi:hypothetical protein